MMLQDIPIHQRIINFNGLKNTGGIFVVSIEKDTPASFCHLKDGDIIIGFDGHVVNKTDDLFKLLTEEKINVRSEISVIRNTQKLIFDIYPRELAA